MTLSDDDFFTNLVQKLITLDLLSEKELDSSIKDLGGIKGVISDKYYILACEYIAREIPQKRSSQQILSFLQNNNSA